VRSVGRHSEYRRTAVGWDGNTRVLTAMNKAHRLGLLTALAVMLCALFGSSAMASQTSPSRGEAVSQLAPASVDQQSAATPNPEPPGSSDADSDDWSGAPWLLLVLIVPVLVVGGVVLAKRRSRQNSRKL
jgi:cytochrome bd-type quinol oxidase subunit 2